jgi:putative hydrolase of the HAD superfamily
MTGDVPETWEAVFYDIGGVIIDLQSIRNGYVAYLQEFAAEHDLDPEAAIETWRGTLGDHFKAPAGTEYRTARAGYQKAFSALVDGDLSEDDWQPGFVETTKAAMEPEPNVVDTIQRLARTDRHLGIVSDVDTEEAHRMLDTLGLDDAFDTVTTSEAVGYKKPDSRMFEDALDRSGVDPTRSLMVGDRYEHDMQGGKRQDLWTVAYGGTAAEAVADAARDGLRVRDDEAVDFHIEDHAELLDIVGVD